MATKKAVKRTVRKAAAKKAPAKKPATKKAAKAPAKRAYVRKAPVKAAAPTTKRAYNRKPKNVEVVQPEQLDKTDAEVAAAQNEQPDQEGRPQSFGEFLKFLGDGCGPCDEMMEESALSEVDILDVRGMDVTNRIALLTALGSEGYITTLMGSLVALDVLPKLLTVDFLALNHNNKLVREANDDEVQFSAATSVPMIRMEVEVLFSKAKATHPMTREINGAHYVRVG